mgnify:CR=1 FL=1
MEGTSIMTSVTTAVGDVFTLMGTCFEKITEIPILLLFLAGSLIGVGIGAFAKLRSVV